ncbi:10416_t:CDS:2 [Entrophospora sp. SA101]|nr:10416_t:CDS:2 [Entrophospora sp. SA101]
MSDRTLRYGVIFDVIFKSEVFMDYDIQKITEKKIRFCLRYILYGHKFTKSEKQYINDFANNFIDRRNIKEGSNKRRKCKICKNMVVATSYCESSINILNGIRPEIPNKFPDKLKKLLKQCWDAIPDNRPDAKALWIETKGILRDLYNKDQNLQIKVTSKTYYTKQNDLVIPDDILLEIQ